MIVVTKDMVNQQVEIITKEEVVQEATRGAAATEMMVAEAAVEVVVVAATVAEEHSEAHMALKSHQINLANLFNLSQITLSLEALEILPPLFTFIE
jgi:hypothetical protein